MSLSIKIHAVDIDGGNLDNVKLELNSSGIAASHADILAALEQHGEGAGSLSGAFSEGMGLRIGGETELFFKVDFDPGNALNTNEWLTVTQQPVDDQGNAGTVSAGAEVVQLVEFNGPSFMDFTELYSVGGSSSSSSSSSMADTFASDADATGGSATIAELEDNAEDGIAGYVHNLSPTAMCDEFTDALSDEQQLLDDAIVLFNTDNGSDQQFMEQVTDAFENYINEAHPVIVQVMVGVLSALHSSSEKMVAWSALESARDTILNRKADLDVCLDQMELTTITKILSRFTMNIEGQNGTAASPIDKAYVQSLIPDGQGKYKIALVMNDGQGAIADGSYPSTQKVLDVDVTALRKALDAADTRLHGVGGADDVFQGELDEATEEWSEAFNADAAFIYDSRRAANAQDVAYYNDAQDGLARRTEDRVFGEGGDVIPMTTPIAENHQLGEEMVYWLSSDASGDVASDDPNWSASGTSQDDYALKEFSPRDITGAEITPGLKVPVGDQLPAGTVIQAVRDGGQAQKAGTVTVSVDAGLKKFGGGFEELEKAILLRHSLKKDPVSGEYSER